MMVIYAASYMVPSSLPLFVRWLALRLYSVKPKHRSPLRNDDIMYNVPYAPPPSHPPFRPTLPY